MVEVGQQGLCETNFNCFLKAGASPLTNVWYIHCLLHVENQAGIGSC